MRWVAPGKAFLTLAKSPGSGGQPEENRRLPVDFDHSVVRTPHDCAARFLARVKGANSSLLVAEHDNVLAQELFLP
jgi:hypothetical protein